MSFDLIRKSNAIFKIDTTDHNSIYQLKFKITDKLTCDILLYFIINEIIIGK